MKKERMRSFFLSFLFLTVATIALAQGKKISLKLNKVSLPSALNQVERQSGYYKINYDVNQVGKYKVSAEINQKEALDAVNVLLHNLPLSARLDGRYILIRSAKQTASKQGHINPKGVNGRIVDQTGEPLIGVTVIVPGTQKMTVTDNNGNFTLPAADANDRLEFSYVGKKALRRKASSHFLNIVLDDDENLLMM